MGAMNDEATAGRRASIERTVECVDRDATGHQHNSAIMRWVESAEAELFRNLGLPEYFPTAPRVQQVVNFKSKLWFGQRVTATVAIRHLGRSSVTYSFEVYGHAAAQSGGAVAAFRTVTAAYVPSGATRSQPWPRNIREAATAHLLACSGMENSAQ